MNGFGAVTKKDAADWSLINAITSLSEGEKKLLYEALNTDKEAILLYINRFYVIKNADFYVKEGKKLATTAQLTASTFLTANGAWSFESANEAHQQFQDLVLNIAGITVHANVLRVANRAPRFAAEKPRPEGDISKYKYNVVKDTKKGTEELVLSGDLQIPQQDTKKE